MAGFLQGMKGCGWQMLHLVAGEETAEVQGLVGKVVVDYPTAHAANHLHVVVDGGNEEVGEFYPYACIAHRKNGVEYGLQMAAADALIDVVTE